VSSSKYIELNRMFFELSADYTKNADNDDLELSEALGLKAGNDIGWDELLKKHRVILLSKAGSGKTQEIRQAAIKLQSNNKPAFFLRLENIPDGLEDSFEKGKIEEFEAWLESSEEGWLFLDSVDEARLRDPKDFKKAIRILTKHITPALDRAHIIITGRANAWRAKTDLELCRECFPYKPAAKKEDTEDDSEEISLEEETSSAKKISLKEASGDTNFEFYTLSDLSDKQIEDFLKGNGISDVSKILDDIGLVPSKL